MHPDKQVALIPESAPSYTGTGRDYDGIPTELRPRTLPNGKEIGRTPNPTGQHEYAYGIEYCGSPLGSRSYRAMYIEAKVSEICSDIMKISTTLSPRSLQALMAIAPSVLHTRFEYVCRTNYPSEVRAAAARIDATLMAAEEPLGLNATDPDAVQDPSFVTDRLALPVRLRGAGLVTVVSRVEAAFLNMADKVIPALLDKRRHDGAMTYGFCPQLAAIFGEGSFDSGAQLSRWSSLLQSDTEFAREFAAAHAVIAERHEALYAAAGVKEPEAVQNLRSNDPMVAPIEQLGYLANGARVEENKLCKAIMRAGSGIQSMRMQQRAEQMERDDARRIAYGQATKESMVLFSAPMDSDVIFSNCEFNDAIKTSMGLPTQAGCAANAFVTEPGSAHPQFDGRQPDKYGRALPNIAAGSGGDRKVLHDTLNGRLKAWAKETGAACEFEVADFVARALPPGQVADEFGARSSSARDKANIIPDWQISLEEEESFGKQTGGAEVFGDTKLTSSNQCYVTPSNLKPGSAVDQRQRKVVPEYTLSHAKLDETLYGIPRGSGVIGPFSQLLKDQAGDVKGTVIGVYGELSSHVLSFLKYLATRRARAYAAASGTDPSKAFGAFYWQYRRHFVLTAIRGWSRIRLRTSSAICHRRRHGRTDTASESKERAAGLRRARNAFDSHQRVARRS